MRRHITQIGSTFALCTKHMLSCCLILGKIFQGNISDHPVKPRSCSSWEYMDSYKWMVRTWSPSNVVAACVAGLLGLVERPRNSIGTPWKFNSSPLKISHPQGKDRLPTIDFQVRTVKLRGCKSHRIIWNYTFRCCQIKTCHSYSEFVQQFTINLISLGKDYKTLVNGAGPLILLMEEILHHLGCKIM